MSADGLVRQRCPSCGLARRVGPLKARRDKDCPRCGEWLVTDPTPGQRRLLVAALVGGGLLLLFCVVVSVSAVFLLPRAIRQRQQAAAQRLADVRGGAVCEADDLLEMWRTDPAAVQRELVGHSIRVRGQVDRSVYHEGGGTVVKIVAFLRTGRSGESKLGVIFEGRGNAFPGFALQDRGGLPSAPWKSGSTLTARGTLRSASIEPDKLMLEGATLERLE